MSVTEQQAVAPSTTTGAAGVVAHSEPEARPPRRSDAAEAVARLRAAFHIEPGRLRLLGAAAVAALLVFGLLASWQMSERRDSTSAVIDGSQPLSMHAAQIYRSLADANTTAASGFLTGGNENQKIRDRYDQQIGLASESLSDAAANGRASDRARAKLSELTEQLPVYTGLVETARANNRQGLPVGGAYLRHADEMMREDLLPTAEKLYDAQSEQLNEEHESARSLPWLALLWGVAVLALLVWLQRRHFLRTNRVFNRGLVAATCAAALLLVWVLGSGLLAQHHLDEANRNGTLSLDRLNSALVAALKARGNEGMALVSRGAGDQYTSEYEKNMKDLAGSSPEDGDGGLLREAEQLADDEAGREPVRSALRNAGFWHYRNGEVRKREAGGEYSQAVAMVIGSRGTTGETFDKVNGGLSRAIKHEQTQFTTAAERGRNALDSLPVGAVVLVLVGAAGAVAGIGRRLAEYR
ncbi:hypothetical protein [Streptomyces tardus]|uniref:hypothetical protein n=1 Tax=Streptomyces tardus TaxID=2780544 RepID=UPI0027E5B3D2|nr:hypothetical protein [Streptomyces tardus]